MMPPLPLFLYFYMVASVALLYFLSFVLFGIFFCGHFGLFLMVSLDSFKSSLVGATLYITMNHHTFSTHNSQWTISDV